MHGLKPTGILLELELSTVVHCIYKIASDMKTIHLNVTVLLKNKLKLNWFPLHLIDNRHLHWESTWRHHINIRGSSARMDPRERLS